MFQNRKFDMEPYFIFSSKKAVFTQTGKAGNACVFLKNRFPIENPMKTKTGECPVQHRFTTAPVQGYDIMAQRMVQLASRQPGFLGVESARESLGITVPRPVWRWVKHGETIKN